MARTGDINFLLVQTSADAYCRHHGGPWREGEWASNAWLWTTVASAQIFVILVFVKTLSASETTPVSLHPHTRKGFSRQTKINKSKQTNKLKKTRKQKCDLLQDGRDGWVDVESKSTHKTLRQLTSLDQTPSSPYTFTTSYPHGMRSGRNCPTSPPSPLLPLAAPRGTRSAQCAARNFRN